MSTHQANHPPVVQSSNVDGTSYGEVEKEKEKEKEVGAADVSHYSGSERIKDEERSKAAQ